MPETPRRILLSQAHVTEVEERYVLDALRSGWVAPLGPSVDRFEDEIAERTGVAGALALSSGTAALHLALLGVGVRPGRVVVLPTMTFAASVNAVLYTGAYPVFVDAQADGNVDPELLLAAVDTLIRDGADVAAVMTVDLFGRCCQYERIVEELAIRDIPLIEDAAEALGASRHGSAAGSFGRAAALSFNGNKIMTTSGGGMLLSNDLDLLARARYLSTQARQPVPWYEHTEAGYNYRLSNLLAALGLGQLERLDGMIARRRTIRGRYAAAFSGIDGVRLIGRDDQGGDAYDNCWLTGLIIERVGGVPTSEPGYGYIDRLIRKLDAGGVEARHLWKPLHAQPGYGSAQAFLNGTSEQLFRTGITLPSGSALTDEDVDLVIDAFMGALTEAELVAS